jgi:hypothetical protein
MPALVKSYTSLLIPIMTPLALRHFYSCHYRHCCHLPPIFTAPTSTAAAAARHLHQPCLAQLTPKTPALLLEHAETPPTLLLPGFPRSRKRWSKINPPSIRPTKQHHEALHHPLPKQHPETNRPPPTSTGPSSPSSANPTRSCTTPFPGREITNWWVRRLICRISICLRAQCHEASLMELSRARRVPKGEGSPVVIRPKCPHCSLKWIEDRATITSWRMGFEGEVNCRIFCLRVSRI